MFYVDTCFAEHMYTTCVSVKYRGQGGWLESLDLELQVMGNHRVGTESQTSVLCKSSQCSSQWGHGSTLFSQIESLTEPRACQFD